MVHGKHSRGIKSDLKKVEHSKICAALSYIILGIVWYFVDDKMKKSKFVNFHVKQGIVLFVAVIIYNILINLLFGLMLFPLFFMGMQFVSFYILQTLHYVPLVFMIIGVLNVLNEQEKELPVIGKYARKLKF